MFNVICIKAPSSWLSTRLTIRQLFCLPRHICRMRAHAFKPFSNMREFHCLDDIRKSSLVRWIIVVVMHVALPPCLLFSGGDPSPYGTYDCKCTFFPFGHPSHKDNWNAKHEDTSKSSPNLHIFHLNSISDSIHFSWSLQWKKKSCKSFSSLHIVTSRDNSQK